MARISIFTVRNEVVKVMFLQASVCPRGGGGCLPQCVLGYHPPRADTPREQTPPGADIPPGADTPPEQTPPPRADTHPQSRRPPQSRHTHTPGSRHPHPQEQTPPLPGSRPPRSRHPLPPRYSPCCGRYASYWNAFFFIFILFTYLYVCFVKFQSFVRIRESISKALRA